MIIYDQEKDDGIDVQALTSSCISYASHVEPCNQDFVIQSLKTDKAIANIKDRDLYYVQSILVTSNWNKNDDVFDSAVYMTTNEIALIKRDQRSKEWQREVAVKLESVKEVLSKVDRYATI